MPVLNNRYTVYIEGIGDVGIKSVEGLGFDATYGLKNNRRKNEEMAKCRELTFKPLKLKWAVTEDNALYKWAEKSIVNPRFNTIKITLYNNEYIKIASWTVKGAIPTKYRGPILNGGENNVAVEEIEIKYLSLTRD